MNEAAIAAGMKPRPVGEWITFNIAIGKVVEALRFHEELAEAILFGLIANQDIRVGDAKGKLIDTDQASIGEVRSKLRRIGASAVNCRRSIGASASGQHHSLDWRGKVG